VTIQDLKQWLDIGLVKNGNMKKFHLKQIIKEQTEETVKQCPAPTQDLELNTASSPPLADLLLPNIDSNSCFKRSSFILLLYEK